ncbi:MAG: hypothetical protein A2Y38_16315 [Spirochaetes bacterium GWB1_59_5]|nr:MAG: hypothetical protein A2Y38_16315 [Spirochaetes bacterium GWB1_59_5]
MTGLQALGYMLTEEKNIIAIRDKENMNRLEYDDLVELSVTLMICPAIYRKEGWEIGVQCEVCKGTGEINVECACRSRPLHSLLENPCCGGWDTATCSECDGEGIRWKKEY